MKKILIPLFFICSIANAATFNKGGNSRFSGAGPTGSYGLSYGSTGAPGTIISPNVGWLPVPGSASSSGLAVQKLEKLPFPAGRTIDVTAKVIASPKNLAKALVNPWGLVASMALQETLGYLADQACVRLAGGQMINTGGMWEECKITYESQKPTLQWVWSEYPEKLAPTATEACALKYKPSVYQGEWSYTPEYAVIRSDLIFADCYIRETNLVNKTSAIGMGGQVSASWRCPDGSIPPNNDKNADCSLSEKKEWVPSPDPLIVAGKIESAIVSNPNLQPSIFNHMADSGSSIEVSDPTITGPSSGPAGDPITTTKTNPDGSTVTSTEQKTNNYQYSGNTVAITSTTTTNVSNNSATNQITTTTTQKPTEPTEDFCKSNPEVIACKELEFDTPESEIPRKKFDLIYSEESFLDGGSCPADVYVSVGGQQVKAIDWQSHCSKISAYVRPLVILLSGFIALLILVPGGREVAS
ncbi:hypothetical protein [Malikia sp.]|uniref:hypothetical protein n=1 Tax=Malikia sp. TaxID=2070706 RepID=UPI002606A169|nr:hypothetical protein [Malikia sp.]MDD2730112.1 hypothetical protein [Malikia sp.]